MTPSKKKLLKPKEVSLDPSIKMETPTAELPNDENQLFGEDVMLEHLPSLTFHYPVRMRKKKSSPTMSGNMLLMSYSNCPHFILKEKVSESGSNIKTFRLSNRFFQWNENETTIGYILSREFMGYK